MSIRFNEKIGVALVEFGGDVKVENTKATRNPAEGAFEAVALRSLTEPVRIGTSLRSANVPVDEKKPEVLMVFKKKESVETVQKVLDQAHRNLGGIPLPDAIARYRARLQESINQTTASLEGFVKINKFNHTCDVLSEQYRTLTYALELLDSELDIK